MDRQPLAAALGLSAMLHAILLGVVLPRLVVPVTPPPRTAPVVLPISLVSLPGGGGGGPRPGPPAPGGAPEPSPAPSAPVVTPRPAPQPPEPVVATVEPLPKPPEPVVARPRTPAPARKRPVAKPKPAPETTELAARSPATTASPTAGATDAVGGIGGAEADGTGAGRGPGGPGTGDGTGGDGGGARPAYGTNPKPPYPLAARRLGLEGVVVLEVVVHPDGSPGEVIVRKSSGHTMLDESAATTVRTRWRFVPARRGNVPVEDRVTFPVRFDVREG